MAYTYRFPQSWYTSYPNLKNFGSDHFYNIDASVGVGGVNRSGDVLLVQYLLYWWAHWAGEFRVASKRVGNAPDFGKPTILVNGAFDQLTTAWIYDFQLSFHARLHELNGRIDPIPLSRGPTAHSAMKELNMSLNGLSAANLKDPDLSRAPLSVKEAVKTVKS